MTRPPEPVEQSPQGAPGPTGSDPAGRPGSTVFSHLNYTPARPGTTGLEPATSDAAILLRGATQ